MNRMFIKMLTVSALSLTMLFGASFATSENMTSLNMTIAVEESHDFIVIEGSEYISTEKLSEIGVSVILDNAKVMVGANQKTYRITAFDTGEAIKLKNKIYLPFKDVMTENQILFEYTSSDTMRVRYADETFVLLVKNEKRPYDEVKSNNSYKYIKIEDNAKKVDNVTEAMKIEMAIKIEDEKK